MTVAHAALGVDFDPWADENFDDPISVYDMMRETDPIHWNPRRKMWYVARYSDVMDVLKDREHFAAAPFQAERPHMERSKSDQHREFAATTMLTNERPRHTRLRRPANPSFSPKRMKGFEAEIEKIADRLLDAVSGRAEWDVIASYAYPLPVLVVAALLGIEPEDQKELMSLVRADAALLAIDPRASQETLDRYAQMGDGIKRFVEQIVAKKRGQPPSDDLMSVLLAEESAGRYSDEELLATVHLMIEAGHVTTVNLIGNGVNLLLEDATRLRQLAEDPSLARSAVEECLRLDGPVHFAGRIAIDDVELRGNQITKGEIVIALFTAANRDPEQFPDPQAFVIDRSPNTPTNFGAGIHHCIGANLARAEAAVAFRRLASRFPRLALAGQPVRQRTFELRGFRELMVTSNGGG
jgi:cytochrome P450